MKIISDFKDYYDFVVNETDNRKTYVRETKALSSGADKAAFYNKVFNTKLSYVHNIVECGKFTEQGMEFFKSGVWFCDKFYRYIFNITSNEYYYALEQVPIQLYKKSLKVAKLKPSSVFEYLTSTIIEAKGVLAPEVKDKSFYSNFKMFREYKFNTSIDAPVFFQKLQANKIGEVEVVNGCLKDINFNKIFKPEEAYTELYNWIPFVEPIMPSDPKDIQRFEGKGFDKVTSFRHPVNKAKND